MFSLKKYLASKKKPVVKYTFKYHHVCTGDYCTYSVSDFHELRNAINMLLEHDHVEQKQKHSSGYIVIDMIITEKISS